ncbi:MAG: substrate-binding domain-containing protein [Spirochaetes bacterium]|nr:substrate-binding domain-containing protein [Spirochaetota bacterium]
MKKLLAGIVALMLIASPVAFAGGRRAADGPVVGFSVSTLNNPFFVTMVEGAQARAAELGIQLVVLDAGDDAARQASDMEDLIARRVNVIIVNPVDSDAITPSAIAAMNANIQVIAVDRLVNGVNVAASIASDNVAGARMATEYLLQRVGQGAEVAELQGILGASATIDRGEGFHQVATGNLNVVTSQTANFNRAAGLNVTENILQGNPNIRGIFAHNDEMALGAIEALGGRDIVVVGFDATDDALIAVQDGRMAATVAQQPDLMGSVAVETAQSIIYGHPVQPNIPVNVSLVTTP